MGQACACCKFVLLNDYLQCLLTFFFSIHSLLLRFTDDTFDPDIGATIGKIKAEKCMGAVCCMYTDVNIINNQVKLVEAG